MKPHETLLQLDEMRTLRDLGLSIDPFSDPEERESYLLERGGIIRGKLHFKGHLPKGLVIFDIESDWVSLEHKRLLSDRSHGDPLWQSTRRWKVAKHMAKLRIHTIGVHNGSMMHYNCDPKPLCSDEVIEQFVTEQLEPAEVIMGFNVLDFDLLLLHWYTDIKKLAMKTVDLHKEAMRFFGDLAVIKGRKVRISLNWLLRNNDMKMKKFETIGGVIPLAEEVEKCEDDVLVTLDLYKMYLDGTLCMEEKWQKYLLKDRI